MNYLTKITSVACLALVAESASAYNYISRPCGNVTGYSNVSRVFFLA
ncbi:MAG: hypothetical protein HKN19_13770, partial [Halioglobus sp.]|nr:hypothetical protein [Halioglobus sp.]